MMEQNALTSYVRTYNNQLREILRCFPLLRYGQEYAECEVFLVYSVDVNIPV